MKTTFMKNIITTLALTLAASSAFAMYPLVRSNQIAYNLAECIYNVNGREFVKYTKNAFQCPMFLEF